MFMCQKAIVFHSGSSMNTIYRKETGGLIISLLQERLFQPAQKRKRPTLKMERDSRLKNILEFPSTLIGG